LIAFSIRLPMQSAASRGSTCARSRNPRQSPRQRDLLALRHRLKTPAQVIDDRADVRQRGEVPLGRRLLHARQRQ